MRNSILRDLILFIGFFAIGVYTGQSLGQKKQRDLPHIDWMCGTITAIDGTQEPIKLSIEDEMSFDLRESPGLVTLQRCDKDTPLGAKK